MLLKELRWHDDAGTGERARASSGIGDEREEARSRDRVPEVFSHLVTFLWAHRGGCRVYVEGRVYNEVEPIPENDIEADINQQPCPLPLNSGTLGRE